MFQETTESSMTAAVLMMVQVQVQVQKYRYTDTGAGTGTEDTGYRGYGYRGYGFRGYGYRGYGTEDTGTEDTDTEGTGTEGTNTEDTGTEATGTEDTGDDTANVESDAVTTPGATFPAIDASGQVSWSFAPQASDLTLELMEFVEMPLADNGSPARWNDMEYTQGRLFVSNEHDGKIYEITDRQPRLWFDVASAIQSTTGRELNIANPFHGGVRGIAFHPEFSTNGKLYISMIQDRPANPEQFTYLSDAASIDADSVVAEWTVDPDTFVVDESSYREVFRVGIPEYDHPIKQIEFNPVAQPGDEDYGLLYVSHGDGSLESSVARDGEGNNALGKILRINPLQDGDDSYSVPASNPFVDSDNLPAEVYSLGHRNPQHQAFLPDGQLLVTEVGRDNIDEANLIKKGANYGWSRREGSFVHLDQGTLVNGISALPEDDADNELTYPVIQFGHTGAVGDTFVGEGLGGGFLMNNGSELDNKFFYVEFVTSGRLFYSTLDSIMASQSVGGPADLTIAQTFETSIVFDNDEDASTAALATTMPELLQSTGSYDGSGRADVRIGQGPLGEMYLMNKRNNVIYLVTNSYPPGAAIPAGPEVSGTTRVVFDVTVAAYSSDELQVRLFWGEKDISASYITGESWAVSEDFPVNTANLLVVEFRDRDGEIILGRFETDFRTDDAVSEAIQISADQFDYDQFDDDGDGISNIDELRAGSDPLNIQ